MIGAAPSLGLAFLAGLASFLSPCVFALVPAYVGYLGGRSAAAAGKDESATWTTFSHGLAFVLGFSAVFILLGLLSSALGALLYDFQWILSRIGGLVVIAFGAHLTGLVRIPFLDFDLRPQSQPQRQRGYWSSAMMGVFFSAGWSPCIGPVLGLILTLAINGGSVVQGSLLLTAYSVGLAIPFLLAATQISWVNYLLKKYGRLSQIVERAMGVILIIVGVLLLSGRLSTLGNLGAFFDILDEAKIGAALLVGFGVSVLIGLASGLWASFKGNNIVDRFLLGSGLSFFAFLLLYALGVFKFLNI
jgi:cytochrome c-type biogenesis protein